MSRPDAIYRAMRHVLHARTDRTFLILLLAQWVSAVVLALVFSPYTYTGSTRELHIHVQAAAVFGGLINALPIALILLRPGWWGTRQAIAIAQMLWSGLLIMITGGRIETHFHVFGSLAFLAFYRDWRVLPTATLVIAADHLARGMWWPDSAYGVLNPEWWRFLEHAAWVVFEDVVLVVACLRGAAEMREAAVREAHLEDTTATITRNLERYRALVENTAAIPFELDLASRRLRYVAPQAAQLLECHVDELADPDLLRSVVHPEDAARLAAWLDAFAREGGATTSLDYRLALRSGTVLHVRTILSGAEGDSIRGLTLDQTSQRRHDAERQQAQKLASVGRLAAGVAHEINTPIQFVGDSIEFVEDAVANLTSLVAEQRAVVRAVLDELPARALAVRADQAVADADLPYLLDQLPAALARAGDGIDRVASIVRSMGVFAHPDRPTMRGVDVNHAITTTLTLARNEYRYLADVVTELAPVPAVWCHAGDLNQVILNILINAAHAIDETGRRGTISVRSTVRAGDVVIEIADTGGGIPEHVRDQIFEPFFTTKDIGKGTGQGLAIARSLIVERYGGALVFETAIGVGTTFRITLPAHAEDLEVAA